MKANIKLKEWTSFLKGLSNDETKLNEFYHEYSEHFKGRWNESNVRELSTTVDKIISYSWGKYHITFKPIEEAEISDNYIKLNDFNWNVLQRLDKYLVVGYGKVTLFITEEYVDLIPETDYSGMSIAEVKRYLLDSDDKIDIEMKLPMELNALSINDINNKQDNVISKMDQLKSEIEDVKSNKNEELAVLQKEIDEKMTILQAKKEAMLAELNEKMAEFNEKLKVLKQQIFMLKTNIYSIRCFAGETVEVIQIRDGKKQPDEVPIVLNQKMLYLDEDLAKTMSIYTNAIEQDYKLLEEALKYDNNVLEMFCPQYKCITFFKCSRNNKNYFYDHNDAILQSYDMLHGNKVGFVVRNGEQVFVGWLEEEWDNDTSDMDKHTLSFVEDVMYKPQVKQIDENDKTTNTTINEAVSRYFALSVVQGLIEHESILLVPEKVDIRVPSKYIIHNYADGWLDDNRYGDFATFVKIINQYAKVGNTILLIHGVSERNGKPNEAERARGYRNTTRDCKVKSGIHNINLIEDGRVFISAPKEDWLWIERKNNANFEVCKDEYIDITYLNSIWLKYFIDTKKIGNFGSSRNQYGIYSNNLEYSFLIKHFKIAMQFIKNREQEEKELIAKYVPNLDKYNWIELLSHWKIYNSVKTFTDFRAKQFAKYLLAGDYYKIANLFSEPYSKSVEDTLYGSFYIQTHVSDITTDSSSHTWNENREKIPMNDLIYDNVDKDYYTKQFRRDTPEEEIKEREIDDYLKVKRLTKFYIQWAKDRDLVINMNEFYKYAPEGKLTSYLKNTNDFIKHNLEFAYDKYDEAKDILFNEIKSSKYVWIREIDEKLHKLLYYYLIQMILVHDLETMYYKTLKYNYKYKIERF